MLNIGKIIGKFVKNSSQKELERLKLIVNKINQLEPKIKEMSAKEQGDLYAQYLKKHKWQPGIPLGMMQAAPSMANKPDDHIVYKKGSKAYKQNPNWIGPEGEITVESIKKYYGVDKYWHCRI